MGKSGEGLPFCYICMIRAKNSPEEKERSYMAMTRNALKAMGLNEEQISSIIEMHTETVNGLKGQIENYKADAEKLPTVQKELDDLKKGEGEDWKARYDAEKAAHDKTKADHAAKETAAQKKALYRALLKEAGVQEKRIDSVLKLTDFNAVKLEGDKLKDAEELTRSIREEWADFIAQPTTEGADVDNPPDGKGGDKKDMGKMSMEEYIAARKKK